MRCGAPCGPRCGAQRERSGIPAQGAPSAAGFLSSLGTMQPLALRARCLPSRTPLHELFHGDKLWVMGHKVLLLVPLSSPALNELPAQMGPLGIKGILTV